MIYEYIPSEYRVIEIIDEYSLLVNYGADDGAVTGEELIIYEEGPEVIDPFSKEVLGTLDSIKETVEVYIAYENFSLCKKINRENVDLSSLTAKNNTFNVFSEINVSFNQMTLKKQPIPSPVKVGDYIKICD